jgi:hypothetical protein
LSIQLLAIQRIAAEIFHHSNQRMMQDGQESTGLTLPVGASDLTCHPLDDFDAIDNWVELAQLSVKSNADGFWHCMRQWTHERHWNRTIWKISLRQQLFSELPPVGRLDASTAEEPVSEDKYPQLPFLPDVFVGPPSAQYRWTGLRELHRKTPAPIGGGSEGLCPSHTAFEWTTQYVSQKDGRHTAIFGLVIPEAARADSNLRALTYWPFQYAKVRALSLTFEPNEQNNADEIQGGESGVLRYRVLPLSAELCTSGRDFEATRLHASKSALRVLNECRKRAERYDPILGNSVYVKRVVHDSLVAEDQYRAHYDRLKAKYGTFWASNWPEVTDPVKVGLDCQGSIRANRGDEIETACSLTILVAAFVILVLLHAVCVRRTGYSGLLNFAL